MKKLKTYKVFEAINLPLGVNDKPIYPYGKIRDFCNEFDKYFEKNMKDEGWFIGIGETDWHTEDWDFDPDDVDPNAVNDEVFTIVREKFSNTSYTQAEEYAKQYGFIFNEKGVIYDIDEEIYNKHKHIVTGTDLNLL